MQAPVRSFRDHVSAPVRQLAETAELLSVSEADVFTLAYRYWYDRDLDERLLDDVFGAYLTRGELPEWVRGFCRRVLARACSWDLDPREFGVEETRRRPPPDRWFAPLATFAVFVVFWLFLS